MTVLGIHESENESLTRIFATIFKEGYTLARFSTPGKKTFIKTISDKDSEYLVEYEITIESKVGRREG